MKTLNKTILLSMLGVALIVQSCSEKPVERIDEGIEEEYLAEIREKDSVIGSIFTAMEDIEAEITMVRSSVPSTGISNTDYELSSNQKERIISDIRMFGELLKESRTALNDYQSQVKSLKNGETKFKSRITELEQKMAEKEKLITELNDLIADLQNDVLELTMNVNNLQQLNAEQNDFIRAQEEELNTAYVCVGTKKELKNKEILEKKGIFKRSAGTVNPGIEQENLSRVNIMYTQYIPVNAKKAELITYHPEGSYQFTQEDGQISKLEILDSRKFWQNSKLLVVQTN